MARGSNRKRRRTERRTLPPVRSYVRYRGGGRRYWRLGGPLTKDHEAEALAEQRRKARGRFGRLVLRLLGGSAPPRR